MRIAAAIALLTLAGCQSAPERIVVPEVVHVTVPKYITPPAELTRPCPVAELEGRTVADVVEAANARKVALEQCNEQIRQIRNLGESE